MSGSSTKELLVLDGAEREAALKVARRVIRHLHLPGRPFLPTVPARAFIGTSHGPALDPRIFETLVNADRVRGAPNPCLHELWWDWGDPPRLGDVAPEDAPVQLGQHRIWEVTASARAENYLPADPPVLEHALVGGDGGWVFLSSGQGEGVLATRPDLMRRVRATVPWAEAQHVASFVEEMDDAAAPVKGWGRDLIAHIYGPAGP